MNFLQTIRTATINARQRTGDETISVSVRQGRFRIERVTYNRVGASTVTPLSDYMAANEAVARLDAMGA